MYLVKINVSLFLTIDIGSGLTLIKKKLLLNCDKESVAVTIYVIDVLVVSGLPVMYPVPSSNDNPLGSFGPIANVTAPSPPR